MANPIQSIASNPLQLVNPLSGFGLLPNNPVSNFAEKTINNVAAPITKPIQKATGIKVNAAPIVEPAAFGASGLQIPQG
jgi:hypothetical protein